jgi:hypothetical protein
MRLHLPAEEALVERDIAGTGLRIQMKHPAMARPFVPATG